MERILTDSQGDLSLEVLARLQPPLALQQALQVAGELLRSGTGLWLNLEVGKDRGYILKMSSS